LKTNHLATLFWDALKSLWAYWNVSRAPCNYCCSVLVTLLTDSISRPSFSSPLCRNFHVQDALCHLLLLLLRFNALLPWSSTGKPTQVIWWRNWILPGCRVVVKKVQSSPDGLGSMLWSQFSAIFANFRRKNWRFSQKSNGMIKMLHNLALFWIKTPFFRRKYFWKS
jgi:hypothetical protein